MEEPLSLSFREFTAKFMGVWTFRHLDVLHCRTEEEQKSVLLKQHNNKTSPL